MNKTSDAVEILKKRFGNDPEMEKGVAEELFKMRIGQIVYDLRENAGLTHDELAARTGIDPETIRRTEVADYDDGPVEILVRVCMALHRSIQINCADASPNQPCDVILLSA